MSCELLKKLKAAFLCAAFLFNAPLNLSAKASDAEFESVKTKATELLLQKKKSQAMQLILTYRKNMGPGSKKDETTNFMVKVAQKFIFREAQEAYENSINLTVENAKEAYKNNEQCLAIEPQQLECLVQKTRLLIREKNNRAALDVRDKVKELVPLSRIEGWIELASAKRDVEFKNKQIIKYIPNSKAEENIWPLLLELERSFLAKNYSRAKDVILYFEKNYPDWPDLLFFKNKINTESAEERHRSTDANAELLSLYANRCKNLSKNIARKFRYDFDLCIRKI